MFLESGAVELTTDFIVGADEDSLLVQRPDQPAARPDLSRLRDEHFSELGITRRDFLFYTYVSDRAWVRSVADGRSAQPGFEDARRARSGGRCCLPVCGVGWSCGALREAHFLSPSAQTSGADSRADPADLVGAYVDRDEASSREAQTQVVRIDRVVYVVLVERS